MSRTRGLRRRVAVVAVAVAVALAGCSSGTEPGTAGPGTSTATTSAPATAPTTAPPVPATTTTSPGADGRCSLDRLAVGIHGAPNAAGHRYLAVTFTNRAGAACTLYGYPGVSALDGAGQEVRVAGREPTEGGPTLVTLAPGGIASAALHVSVAGNYPPDICGETVTPATLRVYPPGETVAASVPFAEPLCRSGANTFGVAPVQAGDLPEPR